MHLKSMSFYNNLSICCCLVQLEIIQLVVLLHKKLIAFCGLYGILNKNKCIPFGYLESRETINYCLKIRLNQLIWKIEI